MKLSILASGSEANCAYLSYGDTSILIDVGLSIKHLRKQLSQVGSSPDTLTACVISHEHSDHVKGVNSLLRYSMQRGSPLPLYVASSVVSGRIQTKISMECPLWRYFAPGLQFQIGDIVVDPFTVLHDAAEPVGFIFTVGEIKIGFAIDLGCVAPVMFRKFRECQVVVIESNYSEAMLQTCLHPPEVKNRISSRTGHLSNDQTAELLRDLNCVTKTVVLAHLSRSSNDRARAVDCAQEALDASGSKAQVLVATQDHVLEVL